MEKSENSRSRKSTSSDSHKLSAIKICSWNNSIVWTLSTYCWHLPTNVVLYTHRGTQHSFVSPREAHVLRNNYKYWNVCADPARSRTTIDTTVSVTVTVNEIHTPKMCYPHAARPASHSRHHTADDNDAATIRGIANPWHVIHLGMPAVRNERNTFHAIPVITITPPPEDEPTADDRPTAENQSDSHIQIVMW